MLFKKGYNTYAGLIVAFLGMLGVAGWFTEADVASLIDLLAQLVGLIYALWGRYNATKGV